MGRLLKEVELERHRVVDEALANGGRQMRYVDLAKKFHGHPVFAGVSFGALARYVRQYALRKNSPCSGRGFENSSNKKRVLSSGFDAIKNNVWFRKGVSFEEVKRISDVIEQIRPHYERLEVENRELLACIETAKSEKAVAEAELAEIRCHNCEEYRAECDAKASKVLGENTQLVARIQEQVSQIDELRNRLRRSALIYQ